MSLPPFLWRFSPKPYSFSSLLLEDLICCFPIAFLAEPICFLGIWFQVRLSIPFLNLFKVSARFVILMICGIFFLIWIFFSYLLITPDWSCFLGVRLRGLDLQILHRCFLFSIPMLGGNKITAVDDRNPESTYLWRTHMEDRRRVTTDS